MVKASCRAPVVLAPRKSLGMRTAVVGIMVGGRGVVRSKSGGCPSGEQAAIQNTRGYREIGLALLDPKRPKLVYCGVITVLMSVRVRAESVSYVCIHRTCVVDAVSTPQLPKT